MPTSKKSSDKYCLRKIAWTTASNEAMIGKTALISASVNAFYTNILSYFTTGYNVDRF